MRVALIRHLPPVIAPGVCYGRLDILMQPDRQSEVSAIAADAALRGMARVWSSPARRCRPLADAIVAALDVPLTVDGRLQELNFGEWEGWSWDSVPRAELDRWATAPLDFRAPGGESGAELIARVRDFWSDICNLGEDCVVISHGGPLRILTTLARGETVDLFCPTPSMGKIFLFESIKPQFVTPRVFRLIS